MPSRDSDRPLPYVQERSQDTVERLLAASEELLAEGGAEAATLRAIAARARMSLGNVYRRFADKDAVLRAVYVRFFERAAASNREALRDGAWEGVSPEALTRAIVDGMARGYHEHRALLRALILYARTHEDPDFRRRAAALNDAVYDRLTELLGARGGALAPPRVRFAVRMAAATLQERIVFGEPSDDGLDVTAELSRALTLYLDAPPAHPAGS
jgi:AcrR family transcriptional regulator